MSHPSFSGQHVLVTGGAGFIGAHLCTALVEAGAQVTVLDNFSSGTRRNLASLVERDAITVIEHDITEPWPLDVPVDSVAHLASLASPVHYLDYPVETLRVGAYGTLNALEYARAHGARFLITSTSEVYGDPLVHPQVETYWGNVNPIGVRSVYDEGKRFSEAATATYERVHGLSVGIARLFNTYGPGMRLDDGRAIPTMACQALSGEPITVSGDGRQTRSFCYVSDTVAGLMALLASRVSGPLNIGNPAEMTLLDLARTLAELTGERSVVEFIPRPSDDPNVRQPCIDAARRELGWEPRVSLAEGLAASLAWFAEELQRLDAVPRDHVREALSLGLAQDSRARRDATVRAVIASQAEATQDVVRALIRRALTGTEGTDGATTEPATVGTPAEAAATAG